MILGVDCMSKLTEKSAAGIAAAGYQFAGRYLVPPVGSLKYKALTRQECEAITGAGLKVLCVWETTANRVQGGADAGAYDGARAAKQAQEMGTPEGAAIYAAVDYDAHSSDFPVIEAYLRAFAGELHGKWRTGVYGSYRVIEAMAERGAADCFWQCCAWSYGKKSPSRNVYQSRFGLSCAGVAIDENECQSLTDAGIWDYDSTFGGEDMTKTEILTELGDRYIASYDELPDWAKPAMRELLDAQIINGGTDAAENADDINMMLSDIKAVIICKRMIEAAK